MTKASVSLQCTIVGTPRVFSVEVDVDVDRVVAELSAKIVATERLDVPPSSFVLYWAKENGQADGAWVASDGEELRMLQSDPMPEETSTTFLKQELRLNPETRVSSYFGAELPRVGGVVHVLVDLRGELPASRPGTRCFS